MNDFLFAVVRALVVIERSFVFVFMLIAYWRYWPALIRNERSRLFFYAHYRRVVRKGFTLAFRSAQRSMPGISREFLADMIGDAFLLPTPPERFRCAHVVPKWMTRSAYHAVEPGVLRPTEWCAKCSNAPSEEPISCAVSCVFIASARLMPGWICCQCKTYNGIQRPNCKGCDHAPCGIEVG